MSVKYSKFELPQRIGLDEESASSKFGRFIVEPFDRGFGHTVATSLRRVLLSAIEAPAIVSLRFEGAPHEYMATEGIIEDMTNIVLNFKGALFRRLPTDDVPGSRDLRILTANLDITREDLDKNGGQCAITIGQLFSGGVFEVVNPELHVFTVTKPLKRQIDIRVAIGRGYVPSERHIIRDKTSDEILIDGLFSPVRLVSHVVENTRVGQDTDFDRLILEIHTDGRITPEEALSFAAQIAQKHFEVFNVAKTEQIVFDEGLSERDTDQDELMEKLALRIDEIELSVRSTNCLSGANIETIAELVSIPEKRMLEFRNFGKKSLNEIKAKLTEMGLGLGMDLSPYGITQDNLKEKLRHYLEDKKGRKEKVREKTSTPKEEIIEEDDDDDDDDV
jgi:DNA-directed RNA polymerase subunit alpha